jgi:signal peptidase I
MSNFQIEPYTLSPWAKAQGLTHCFVYRGPSMNPTFQNGDFLYLCPVAKKFALGDVIVFVEPIKKQVIVHRIVSASHKGLITRGDHNRLCDSPVTSGQVIGKVDLVENKRGIKRASNGLLGFWLARVWHTVFGLDRLFRWMFFTPYHLVRKSGVVPFIWHPKIVKMQVWKAGGSRVKYIYKQRTVATWDPTYHRFVCRKPFDLIIPYPGDAK